MDLGGNYYIKVTMVWSQGRSSREGNNMMKVLGRDNEEGLYKGRGRKDTTKNIKNDWTRHRKTVFMFTLKYIHNILLMNTPIPSIRNFSVSCWLGKSKNSQKDVAIAFGCLQDLEDKTLLLKTSFNLDTGHGRVKWQLVWKPPPQGLALRVSKSVLQAVKEKTQSKPYTAKRSMSSNSEQHHKTSKDVVMASTSQG